MENTTITITKTLAIKLRVWKAQLGCKTLEEVIDRILKIAPAAECDETGVPFPSCEIRDWKEGEFEAWKKQQVQTQ